MEGGQKGWGQLLAHDLVKSARCIGARRRHLRLELRGQVIGCQQKMYDWSQAQKPYPVLLSLILNLMGDLWECDCAVSLGSILRGS